MPGNLRTALQCDRKWTWDECHNSGPGILQYGKFLDRNHPGMRILLWIDGSAEISGQLHVLASTRSEPLLMQLANLVLQALNIACQDPPSPTNPFPVAASSIFNETTIQPPAISSAGTSGSHHLHGTSLALAIALPIVFGFLLLVLTCIACFFSARRRRRQMASRGKMRRVHEGWADSPSTPRATHFDWEQAAMDMEQMQGTRTTQRYSHSPQYSYRDDVGPGTGQIQDHELHEQYFAPIPELKVPIPDGQDEIEGDKAGDVKHVQHTQQEPPNLLHSPVEKHVPYDIGVARGEPPLGDKKDPNQNWI
jgi:hypothetical protein